MRGTIILGGPKYQNFRVHNDNEHLDCKDMWEYILY
jgi:hypothetical protein